MEAGNGYAQMDDRQRSRDERDRADHHRSSRLNDDEHRHRSSSGRRRSRSRSRNRERDRGDRGDRGGRHGSRRSRSRTPPRRQRRRPTLWDVPPDASQLAAAAAAAAGGGLPGLLPGAAGGGGLLLPGLDPLAGVPGLGGAPPHPGGRPGGRQPSQHATRHARRLYVGNLPPGVTSEAVTEFLSNAVAAVGGASAPGNAVLNTFHSADKNFAFVEFRTVEETSNASALDGVVFGGSTLRVKRPNDYNPTLAVNLGPQQPSPHLNLAAVGISPAAAGVGGAPLVPGALAPIGLPPLGSVLPSLPPAGALGGGRGGRAAAAAAAAAAPVDPHRIYVGGLPHYLSEDQCRELLGSFGAIASFELARDRATGESQGYGFVRYADVSVTDVAVAGLNGLQMGDRTLQVRRAAEGAAAGAGGGAAGGGVPPAFADASRVVVLRNAVEVHELSDAAEYGEILQDMQDEAARYGAVVRVTIPRPTPEQPAPPGLGLVVLEYADVNAAVKAKHAMHGRKFGGHVVEGTFLQEADYAAGNYAAAA